MTGINIRKKRASTCIGALFFRDVHKLLNKIGSDCLRVCRQSLLLYRTRFPAGILSGNGIKREHLCESGAIPVAVSSVIGRALFGHCPREDGKAHDRSEPEDLPRPIPVAFFGNKETSGDLLLTFL